MDEQPVYDVVIAGAGPAGDTAAYFLAKRGKRAAGRGFMDDFGAAMTGVKPKSLFLSPRMSIPLGAALLGLLSSRAGTKYASGPRAEPTHDFSFAMNALQMSTGGARKPSLVY